ncbi:unnamed protein product [Diatraea saccharalis]|uniref:G-protein coupled receptors family 1 profile domain-containing protein n=1 Tax=Diatraea saccharalis TaxID=40085 RepID=A0A9N9R212_9NEOP|nr:unnamed protein product [Diatraea saccharalis]
MGDLLNSTNVSFVNVNNSVLGLYEYGSDKALAAVQLFTDYPEALLQFAGACCVLFMLVGIPGNLITIIALARCKKVRNATAIFIINLSCSDLLFGAFNLPLAASTFWNRSWIHGRLLCKMFPLARYALVAVSLFTVLAITINRYIMISKPRLYPKLYKKKYLPIMIIMLWAFSFGALIATWFEKWGRFGLDPVVGSCTIIPDVNNKSPKKFLFIGAFLIPGIAIIFCYARIFWIVKKVAKRSRPTMRMRPKTEVLIRDSVELTPDNVAGNRTNHISLQPKRNPNYALNCLAIPEISSTSGIDTEERDKRITDGDRHLSRSSEAIQKLRVAFTPAQRQPKTPKLLPSKKDKKLRTMIMAIMISFVACHLPISVIKIFLEFSINPYVNMASYVLLYFTTCINPIIYVVMSSEYRQAYKNLMTCQRIEKDFPESTVLGRMTSMKAMASVRRSIRKFHSVNTRSPT